MNDPLARHLAWFARLTPETLAQIDHVYAADAHFRDPFHDVCGRKAIQAIYARMFQRLIAPRFVIGNIVQQGDSAFVTWDFCFALRGRQLQIHGGTLFRLDDAGLIHEHRDYWDAAEGVYEHLPLLGWLLRRLKQRMA